MILTSRYLFYLILSFSILGCAVQQLKPLPEVNLPKDWKNIGDFPVASAEQDLSNWWSEFKDPTLTSLISNALKQSPDLSAAKSRINEARASRTIEKSFLFPDLNASSSASSNVVKNKVGSTIRSERFSLGASSSWEIDWLGKNRNNLEAASAQLNATEENFHSIQALLAAEIASNYIQLRSQANSLEVLDSIVKSFEKTLELAVLREKSGESDALETIRLRSRLEKTKSRIPLLEQSIERAKQRLCLLSGLAPGSLDGILSKGNLSIPKPAARLAVKIPADTIRKRPDVRLAGYQLLAASARHKSAKAELYPSLSLKGTLGISAISASKLFDPQTLTRDIIGAIGAPIFNAGRIRAGIKVQSAIEEQAFENYRSKILLALSEVEDALVACKKTSERFENIQKATVLAREASALIDQSYQAGLSDISNVLDSQRELLELEDELSNLRGDQVITYIRLYSALGGGWKKNS